MPFGYGVPTDTQSEDVGYSEIFAACGRRARSASPHRGLSRRVTVEQRGLETAIRAPWGTEVDAGKELKQHLRPSRRPRSLAPERHAAGRGCSKGGGASRNTGRRSISPPDSLHTGSMMPRSTLGIPASVDEEEATRKEEIFGSRRRLWSERGLDALKLNSQHQEPMKGIKSKCVSVPRWPALGELSDEPYGMHALSDAPSGPRGDTIRWRAPRRSESPQGAHAAAKEPVLQPLHKGSPGNNDQASKQAGVKTATAQASESNEEDCRLGIFGSPRSGRRSLSPSPCLRNGGLVVESASEEQLLGSRLRTRCGFAAPSHPKLFGHRLTDQEQACHRADRILGTRRQKFASPPTELFGAQLRPSAGASGCCSGDNQQPPHCAAGAMFTWSPACDRSRGDAEMIRWPLQAV